MPRKRKTEQLPLETFTLGGVIFEIRDETCWPLGRGQSKALEHYVLREKVIFEKIEEILFENCQDNYPSKVGIEKVKEIFRKPKNFVSALDEWGVFGIDAVDDSDARQIWFPRCKAKILTAIRAYEEKG
jgi:hypothetical protein